MTLRALHGECADIYPTLEPGYSLIVSDGAYGIGGFPGDPKTPKALADWYAPHLEAWDRLAAPSSSLYFWCTPEGCARMLPAVEAAGWSFTSSLRWEKPSSAAWKGAAGMRRWVQDSEDCYFYVREGGPAAYRLLVGAMTERDSRRDKQVHGLLFDYPDNGRVRHWRRDWSAGRPSREQWEAIWPTFGAPYYLTYDDVAYHFALPQGVTDVWSGLPVSRPGRHGCAKRDDHIERIVKASSRPGDRVLEPFGGGAPVLRACKKLGRSCDSIERDPEWHKRALAGIDTAAAVAVADPKALAGQASLFGGAP